MRVQFWGTRGSIATPGPGTIRYGGNTSCVEVRSERGTLVIIDCGTGAHPLGQRFATPEANRVRGHILISHTHWDHIQGLPFFDPLFAAGNEWDIYGPKGLGRSLRDTLAGQMQYTYFPITLDQFESTIRYHDLMEGTFVIDDIRISARYLNHTALTLGYRLEVDGATLVYSSDHEPHSRTLAGGEGEITGQDLLHAEFISNADLLIHDAQYTADEYQSKVGWGHSTIEYVLKLARHARVKRIAFTHHDPLRDDDALDLLIEGARASLSRNGGAPLEVFAAAEGQTLEVKPSVADDTDRAAPDFHAMTPVAPALIERSVLLGLADPIMTALLSDAMRAEGLRIKLFADLNDARKLISKEPPSLAILEHDPARIDDGSCIGTLCLIDTRPRSLDPADVARLRDLSDLAVQELNGMNTPLRGH